VKSNHIELPGAERRYIGSFPAEHWKRYHFTAFEWRTNLMIRKWLFNESSMTPSVRSLFHDSRVDSVVAVPPSHAAAVYGQVPACTVVADCPVTPAETAFSDSRHADAETLYRRALAQSPQDSCFLQFSAHATT
jgi:hypothetical protein